jgi:pimeloyl-ACP methyl ester carboxylesterase
MSATSNRLLRAALLLFAAATVFVVMLSLIAHDLIYHPRDYPANYRHLLGAGAIELDFKSQAGRQTAFYISARGTRGLPDYLWIVFCGNGSVALDWLPLVTRDTNQGDGFLLVDYPGYGRSEGRASMAHNRAAVEDALTALALKLGVPETSLESRLNAIGHSLGAAVALDFARRHRMQKLILLSPFTTLHEEAAGFVGRLLAGLFPDNYDNRAALRELARQNPPPKVTIFHGLEDSMIPPEMGRELAGLFPTFVTFRPVPRAGHSDVVLAAEDEILLILGKTGN